MEKKTIATVGAGLVAAAALGIAGASFASAAATPTPSASAGYGTQGRPPMANGNTDPSKPVRSDEQLLTGEVAAKVTAAAKAKEPGATIQRVETDSDGVYEAHMARADGTAIIVQIDKAYAVTDVQVMGQGGAGGPKGQADGAGQGQTSQNPG